jgi:hypothetical protein
MTPLTNQAIIGGPENPHISAFENRIIAPASKPEFRPLGWKNAT